jgi:DNA polymerase I-like protein with 3'-5' exonuclease and polymerase domains
MYAHAHLHVHPHVYGMCMACLQVLQIHDELLFEVEEEHAEELRRAVRTAMVQAWPERLRVPLRVTIKQGPSWGELEVVDEEETPSTG